MDILFIIYLILLLSLIVYLIAFKYFNKNVRENLRNNSQTTTSIDTVNNELDKVDCNERKIYCTVDGDCTQLCSNPIDNKVHYKCSKNNVCVQSQFNSENNESLKSCNRSFGFFPVLKADEIFEPEWICLNTRPYLFNDNQEYHSYVCSGGDQSLLEPQNIFESCICKDDKIKVRDDLRNDIPICIYKHQLSLFPNFTY